MTPQGGGHVFQILKKPFVGLHGERLLLGVASDVTELSELNANQKTLNVCLSGLLSHGDTGFDMDLVLKEIGQRLNASICYLLHYDMENRLTRPEAEWRNDANMPSALQITPEPFAENNAWFRLMNTDELIFAPDVGDPEAIIRFGLWPEINHHFGLKSLYAMRVVIDGKTWGCFGVAYREKHTLTPYETDFVRSAGSLIGLMRQRKRDAEQLRAALEQAQSADRAKSHFLASMSHEIRTPLNAVIGFAELLTDGALPPEEQKDYLESISSAGNTLLALINDVLDLSKLEAGQMQFSPSETDFANLVREVGAAFRQKCGEKNLKFSIELEELPRVWLDKLRIRQILFNLIGNAVKFTNAGEIRVTARFAPENAKQGTLTFGVTDTGIGISEEDQKQLFQMFVQSSAVRGTEAARNGTGLGLAIVRRMIEHMNGIVELESAPGAGSTFTVIIRDVEYREAPAYKEEPPLVIANLPVRGTVLLVDDVAMNLKVMSAMLHKLGMETVIASGADEALSILEVRSFDYFLTDLWMPGMNGAELGARLRGNHRWAKMRMAAVTADTENGEQLNVSFFDTVIAKPVTLEKLRAFLAG